MTTPCRFCGALVRFVVGPVVVSAMSVDLADLHCPNDDCSAIDVDGPMYADDRPTVRRVEWEGQEGAPCPHCGTPGRAW